MAVLLRPRDVYGRFVKQLRSAVARIPPGKTLVFQKKLSLEALRKLVLLTPVDTGRARGGWILQVGAPSRWIPGKQNVDPDGESTVMTGRQFLEELQPFGAVFISNNVEYILHLEHGTSKQAPQGMLKLTVHALLSMFRRNVT